MQSTLLGCALILAATSPDAISLAENTRVTVAARSALTSAGSMPAIVDALDILAASTQVIADALYVVTSVGSTPATADVRSAVISGRVDWAKASKVLQVRRQEAKDHQGRRDRTPGARP
jgi:hypothetical protein